MTPDTTSNRWIIPLAFAIIYLVWGSTYLANAVAIREIPPFLMSGARFMAAGSILFVAAFAFGGGNLNRQQVKNALGTGILFLAIGTGGIVWAMQWIHSGIAALMAAFQPLLIVLLMWLMRGKRPTLRTIFGTLLGMAGMACLVLQDSLISSSASLIGVGVIFISILSWGFASVLVTQVSLPQSRLHSAGLQMIGGGAALLIFSAVTGEMFRFQPAALTAKGIGSWLYLVVFGSLIAYSAFNYLLVKSTPEKVATANYVNPVVAMLLGWQLGGEGITGQSMLAAVLMISGVIFINSRFGFLKKLNLGRKEILTLEQLALETPGAVREIDVQPFAGSDAPVNCLIARIWHGVTPADRAGEYIEWVKNTVAPDCQSIPGNLGYTLLRRTDGDRAYMTVISYWQDFDAVKRFAGEDFHKANIYPEEKKYLLDFEEIVEHRSVKG